MEIHWQVSNKDITKIQDFIFQHSNNFVAQRIARNIENKGLQLDYNKVIKSLILSLLFPNQKPGSHVKLRNLFQINPFPFQYDLISDVPDLKDYVFKTLKHHGINQDIDKVPDFFSTNFELLEAGNWNLINTLEKKLYKKDAKYDERDIADKIDKMFKGFGAIEARIFLQSLGLTKYEIPIDSFVSDWINNFGFPIRISNIALQDRNYYHFILDGIQLLCNKANIYPCVLNAAIHSSFCENKCK